MDPNVPKHPCKSNKLQHIKQPTTTLIFQTVSDSESEHFSSENIMNVNYNNINFSTILSYVAS